MKTLGVVFSMKILGVVCGSVGQLRGRKEQFVAAQIFLKGVAARERFAQLRSRQRIIEGCGPVLHAAQGTYERFGKAVVAQRLQGQQVVFPVDCRNDNSAQSARAQGILSAMEVIRVSRQSLDVRIMPYCKHYCP